MTDANLNPVIGGIAGAIASPGPKQLTVTLSGVADGQKLKVALTGINGTFDLATWAGFLAGDVDGTGVIDAVDKAATK